MISLYVSMLESKKRARRTSRDMEALYSRLGLVATESANEFKVISRLFISILLLKFDHG